MHTPRPQNPSSQIFLSLFLPLSLNFQITPRCTSISQDLYRIEYILPTSVSPIDPLSNFCSSSFDGYELDIGKRERKGLKVKIHDLSGSVVAAAFITTLFVPSTGRDWVARSNPGAWLIVRSDVCKPESWQPWGKLEAYRIRGIRDSICCRFHLLTDGQEWGYLLMSKILISDEKGGEFYIDTERQVRTTLAPLRSPRGSGDIAARSPTATGFIMSCRVQGEGKCRKPHVQLVMRHMTCVEDVAIFMAVAAAVDLSIEACRPFRRKIRRSARHSW